MTDQREMRVTVLVDNYNYGDYVCDAIDSALRQTRPPDEVIVVDDGSTDGSVDRIQTEFKDQGIVRLISKPNGGQLSAFNTGYREITGDLVLFLDADDLYTGEYIERVLAFFDENPDCDFLSCAWEKFGEVSEIVRDHDTDQDYGFSVLEAIFTRNWRGSPTSSLSIRRSILDRFMPLYLEADWRSRADDCLVWGSAIAGAHKYYLADCLVRYRVHRRNAWYGREFSKHYATEREYKINRLVGTVADRCGYDVPTLVDAVAQEFDSAGSRRDLDDLWRYRRVIEKSGRPMIWRRRMALRLWRSYLKGLWSGRSH